MPTDVFKNPLGAGDFILAGSSHDRAILVAYKILGITSKGYLKVRHYKYHWTRSMIQSPQFEAIKITKQQYGDFGK